MDTSSVPQLPPRKQTRASSRSPTRSPTRQRLTDDILTDLSPATTLEAFTSPSGKLKASVEAATPSERAFGIRATLASKKIQEWLTELSAWPWPTEAGSEGFELPLSKRRKTLSDSRNSMDSTESGTELEYMGSLPAGDVEAYETRIEEILEDMDDLHVEDIKSTVLNSHFSQVSRPSSAASYSSNSSMMPAILSNYTKMDDFTAVVTATVLQALPNLSKLMRLMDVWSIRLTVLRKVPPLLDLLDEVEIALQSGWQAIENPTKTPTKARSNEIGEEFMDRKTFEAMRGDLQDKVTNLGRDLDYMLDTLEGRADTLPEHWLDRMEVLEKDYGEWVVSGEKVVREGEWNKLAKARKAEEARRKAEEEARLAAENKRIAEERVMLEELARQEVQRARQMEEERLKLEEVARAEAARIQKEKDAALRLEQERATEAARLAEEERRRKEEALRLREAEAAKAAELAREAEEARIQKERALKLAQEKAAEAARAAEFAQAEKELREKEIAIQLDRERAVVTAQLEAEEKLREDAELLSKAEAQKAVEMAEQSPFEITEAPQPNDNSDGETLREAVSATNLPAVALEAAGGVATLLGNEFVGSDMTSSSELTNRSAAQMASLVAVGTLSATHEVGDEADFEPTSDQSDDFQHSEPAISSDSVESALIQDATHHVSEAAVDKREDEWVVVDTPEKQDPLTDTDKTEQRQDNQSEIPGDSVSHHASRNVSLQSGYKLTDPSPEILEAQPAEYFRSVLSPVSVKHPTDDMEPKTPSDLQQTEATTGYFPALPESPTPAVGVGYLDEGASPISSVRAQDSPVNDLDELGYYREDIEPPSVARRTSVTYIKFPAKRIDLPRRDSGPSNASPINTRQRRHTASSPVVSSPLAVHEPSDVYDESPSTSRLANYQTAYDYTPPGTPPQLTPKLDQQPYVPLSPVSRSSFTDSSTLETETPGTELSLDSGSSTSVHRSSSPRKHASSSSDDQLQTQISNLLESIPAHIRLASEPPEESTRSTRALQTEALRVPKHRSSLGSSSVRSHSSLSMRSRAPTPSFTLAPAYKKGTSKPRPHSNNPEIKLYHLSRSGEAPIKLFVRLVGENGERVMVRVGGGWADLGEYLKEYASHHGRRSGGKEDKVEIQDLGSRNVSGASMISSSSIIRGSGRASPTPRSPSALDTDHPMSSLYIRKTRKSDADSTAPAASTINLRSPSTPVPFTSQTANQLNTPPSGTMSSDVGLGLAGPKSKNVKISERDAEWVESMKEKVRIASMGKELKDLKQREREEKEARRDRGSFGELNQVGGTKRLFKKSNQS